MAVLHGTKALEAWCRLVTRDYPNVDIINMTSSWRSGLGFCALIHHFRPELIDYESLHGESAFENNALAFGIAEQHLGINALLDPEDMASSGALDRLSILTYLSQFYQAFGGATTRSSGASGGHKSPAISKPLVRRESSGLACQFCQKPVLFLLERLHINGLLSHRTCFKCARCRSQLSLANYYETENGDFCCEICPDEEVSQAQQALTNKLKRESVEELDDPDSKPSSQQEEVHAKPQEPQDSLSTTTEHTKKGFKQGEEDVFSDGKSKKTEEEVPDSKPEDISDDIVTDKIPTELVPEKIFEDHSEEATTIEKPEEDSKNVIEHSKDGLPDADASLENTVDISVASQNVIEDSKDGLPDADASLENTVYISVASQNVLEDSDKVSLASQNVLEEDSEKVSLASQNVLEEDSEKVSLASQNVLEEDSGKVSLASQNVLEDSDKVSLASQNVPEDSESASVTSKDMLEVSKIVIEESAQDKSMDASSESKSTESISGEVHESAIKSTEEEEGLPNGNQEEDEEEEYPEDLNPFDIEEDVRLEDGPERSKARKDLENSSMSTSLNPFGSDFEDEETDTVQELLVPPPKPPRYLHLVGLNPFGSDFEDSDGEVKQPPRSVSPSPSTASSIRSRKKRRAPLPPGGATPKQPGNNEKLLKERNNIHRRSMISNDLPPSPCLLSPDKADGGIWKKKKGPAPPRPIPPKRVVKKIPRKAVNTELIDIEIKQLEFERQGVRLEKSIRELCEEPKEGAGGEESLGPEAEDLVIQLFELVNEKNELFRRQTELMYMKREHRLEEEHADLEYQIRVLMNKDVLSEDQKKEEESLISRLMSVVSQRNEIVDCLEMDRLREREEDESIEIHMGEFAAVKPEKPAKKKKKKKKDKKKGGSGALDDDKDIDTQEEQQLPQHLGELNKESTSSPKKDKAKKLRKKLLSSVSSLTSVKR